VLTFSAKSGRFYLFFLVESMAALERGWRTSFRHEWLIGRLWQILAIR
jgi:hypothetical protein